RRSADAKAPAVRSCRRQGVRASCRIICHASRIVRAVRSRDPSMTSFASQADLKPKRISFRRLSENAWAFTAEGDPNSGIILGDNAVMVVDAQATPVMAREVIRRIRRVTSKPIQYVVLSHYHAVRVLGASAYRAREIIASEGTLNLIRERGKDDMASEIGRFPRLFRGAESIPGLTWPTLIFKDELTVMLGKLEIRILHPGAG